MLCALPAPPEAFLPDVDGLRLAAEIGPPATVIIVAVAAASATALTRLKSERRALPRIGDSARLPSAPSSLSSLLLLSRRGSRVPFCRARRQEIDEAKSKTEEVEEGQKQGRDRRGREGG